MPHALGRNTTKTSQQTPHTGKRRDKEANRGRLRLDHQIIIHVIDTIQRSHLSISPSLGKQWSVSYTMQIQEARGAFVLDQGVAHTRGILLSSPQLVSALSHHLYPPHHSQIEPGHMCITARRPSTPSTEASQDIKGYHDRAAQEKPRPQGVDMIDVLNDIVRKRAETTKFIPGDDEQACYELVRQGATVRMSMCLSDMCDMSHHPHHHPSYTGIQETFSCPSLFLLVTCCHWYL